MKRVIVAITGASGAIFGVRLLHMLRSVKDVEIHLVISASGRLTLSSECNVGPSDLGAVADIVHHPSDIAASISSGSFRVHGMIIVPCSMKTMSNIATGNTGDLISRSADVVMKEGKKLVLAVRETPLHAGHLTNMLNLALGGVTIFPPVPAFYNRPLSLQEIVDHSCMRMLDQLDIEVEAVPRWGEEISLKRRQRLSSDGSAEDSESQSFLANREPA